MLTLPLGFQQALKKIGFSMDEVKILGFLFHEKKANTKEISRQTTISYSASHYILLKLVRKGLLYHTMDQEAEEEIFEMCSKKEFFCWIDEQKKLNEEIYENAKLDLNAFLSKIIGSSWKPQILYYEGKEGIIEIYEDILATNRDIYSWLDIARIRESLGEYLYEYIRKRIEKGIISHDIVPRNEENLKHFKQSENRKIKFVDSLPIDGELRIFGDKVAIITFDKEKPIGLVLRGKLIARLFKTIFDSSWESI